jgi:hypothetical protein
MDTRILVVAVAVASGLTGWGLCSASAGPPVLVLVERDGELHEAPPEDVAFCLEPARRRPALPVPWRRGWPHRVRR